MILCRVRLIPCFLLALSAFAQNAPWTGTLRGAWVEAAPAASDDVTLAAKDNVAQIVVADDENTAVHQAAEFLSGDIEKISGYKPAIVKAATNDKVNIRSEERRVGKEGRSRWLPRHL